MNISYQWLQRYFDDPLPTPEVISEALTFHAFELESMERVGKDTVFDVKVTPNRGHDVLCHRGIAKEISAILNIPLAHDSFAVDPKLEPVTDTVELSIKEPARCSRYIAAHITGVSVGPSPLWLQTLLTSVGQRPINNIVDATNFVMFDLGQPLHAFDAKKLKSENKRLTIEVRNGHSRETIETLDNKTYALTHDDLVIADGNADAAIGIAGVKGGKAAEVSAKTTDLIIESATFAHGGVRRTSRTHKLRTEASVRFEHELSPALAAQGALSVVKLIGEIAGGACRGFVDSYPGTEIPAAISITSDDCLRILGLPIAPEAIEDILKRLAFSFEKEGGAFLVTPPPERLDLALTEDLVEEVGRIHGYEQVTPVVPHPRDPVSINKRFYYSEVIRRVFEREGYSEIMTTSFAGSGEVCLIKSVASDKECLRGSLRENMRESLTLNTYNAELLGLSEVRLYELGTVFKKTEEFYHLAWVVAGRNNNKEAMQRMLQVLLDNLGLPLASCVDCIVTDGSGDIIELNIGGIVDRLPEPNTTLLSDLSSATISYRPFSVYPFIVRDLALWIPDAKTPEEVKNLVVMEAGPLLVRIRLFDEFKKGDRTSYAFRLVFQSMERTLTDKEVNAVMKKVDEALKGKGYEIR